MSKQLQLRRGTTEQNKAFIGAEGELSYDTQEKSLRVHDGVTVGGTVFSCPIGMIAPFAGSIAPEGWLICDGSLKSRYRYADLYKVIGTTYGDSHLCFTREGVDYFIINTESGTKIQTFDNTIGVYSDTEFVVSSVSGDTLTDDQSNTYTKDSEKDNPTFNIPNGKISLGTTAPVNFASSDTITDLTNVPLWKTTTGNILSDSHPLVVKAGSGKTNYSSSSAYGNGDITITNAYAELSNRMNCIIKY